MYRAVERLYNRAGWRGGAGAMIFPMGWVKKSEKKGLDRQRVDLCWASNLASSRLIKAGLASGTESAFRTGFSIVVKFSLFMYIFHFHLALQAGQEPVGLFLHRRFTATEVLSQFSKAELCHKTQPQQFLFVFFQMSYKPQELVSLLILDDLRQGGG
jgi:hypothetical protein